jgi:hypothetical protein
MGIRSKDSQEIETSETNSKLSEIGLTNVSIFRQPTITKSPQMAEFFGHFALEASTLVHVLKPLIPLSLSALETLQKKRMQLKNDGSVVTIADFVIQSLILSGIHETFPEDKVIGEEQFGTLTPAFLSFFSSLFSSFFHWFVFFFQQILIRFERVNILFDQNAPIFVWLI